MTTATTDNTKHVTCHACGKANRIPEERLTEQSVRDGDRRVVIRSVPTGVCTKCGEQILRCQATQWLEEILRERRDRGPDQRIEVPVFAFASASERP